MPIEESAFISVSFSANPRSMYLLVSASGILASGLFGMRLRVDHYFHRFAGFGDGTADGAILCNSL